MSVTPEMLLFLAGKMGLNGLHIDEGSAWYIDPFGTEWPFAPQHDDAQFGRLVVWAGTAGLILTMYPDSVMAWKSGPDTDGDVFSQDHDSTPDSIRAAAVVATCRALGWRGDQ